MTNPLHAVAERIGYKFEPAIGLWINERRRVNPADLREELLTGDRPLRIADVDAIGVQPSRWKDGKVVLWAARRFFAGSDTFEAPTPAEAILACAEAVAG